MESPTILFYPIVNHIIYISNHSGCSFCFGTKKSTTEEFIEKAKKVHYDKYDYSLVNYIKNNKKVKIICKKHGVFAQSPINHMNGGCPICRASKCELKIFKYLKNKEIYFENQYYFKTCRNALPLPFDFYLPDHNCCIEYDGIQHFKSIDFFGGEEEFKIRRNNDNIKNNFCQKK